MSDAIQKRGIFFPPKISLFPPKISFFPPMPPFPPKISLFPPTPCFPPKISFFPPMLFLTPKISFFPPIIYIQYFLNFSQFNKFFWKFRQISPITNLNLLSHKNVICFSSELRNINRKPYNLNWIIIKILAGLICKLLYCHYVPCSHLNRVYWIGRLINFLWEEKAKQGWNLWINL